MHSNHYSGNGSISRFLEETVEPWQVTSIDGVTTLLGTAKEVGGIYSSLRVDGIFSNHSTPYGFAFHDYSPEELVKAMDDAGYGVELALINKEENQPKKTPKYDSLSQAEKGRMTWSERIAVMIKDGLTPTEGRIKLKTEVMSGRKWNSN